MAAADVDAIFAPIPPPNLTLLIDPYPLDPIPRGE